MCIRDSAIGAFGVLLAFGAKGHPAVVMAIIFAGAPVVNALISLSTDPPEGGIASVPKLFWIGVAMAAIGGCIVTKYKPQGSKPHGPPPAIKTRQESEIIRFSPRSSLLPSYVQ